MKGDFLYKDKQIVDFLCPLIILYKETLRVLVQTQV